MPRDRKLPREATKAKHNDPEAVLYGLSRYLSHVQRQEEIALAHEPTVKADGEVVEDPDHAKKVKMINDSVQRDKEGPSSG